MFSALMFLYTLVFVAVGAASQGAAAAPDCREWHQCQQQATEAYDRGDYERFHDLAWRAVQTGRANDPALMYLLARAQSLSGRPHDALVMLGRLLERGIAADAATNDDFRAVRALSEWPDLEARLAAVTASGGRAEFPPPTSSRAAGAPRPAAPAAPIPPSTSAPAPAVNPAPPASTDAMPAAEDALRAAGTVASPAGLAYDRVSSRFVVADGLRHKLVVIDERSRHVLDLVTARSAGFFDITGFDVDAVRGDLWVVSAEPSADAGRGATALHKIQLVSGRPLERIVVPDDQRPCRLTDVAVTPNGTVFVLDGEGSRLLRFQPSTRTLLPVAELRLPGTVTLAPVSDHIVYVAHKSGIVRVDTATGKVAPLTGSREDALAGVERMRWMRDSLFGIQRLPDGRRHSVRIRLANGRAASIDIIDPGLSLDEGAAAAVSDDEFYVAVHQAGAHGDEIVIRRSRLR